jgi:triosephosphate isomerase (TIM)
MKYLVIANWKCNPSSQKEANKLFDNYKSQMRGCSNIDLVVCPPFPYIVQLKGKFRNIYLGAQDCFYKEGAFTGEVSASIVRSIGVNYVIVGHSERRNIFNESNKEINNKVKSVLDNKMIPILCIGENEKQREEGETFEVVKNQIGEGLDKIQKDKIKNIILAYEPIWAIGTGKFAEAEKIQEIKIFIKKLINNKYGVKTSEAVKIVYGGSVDSNNISLYLSESQMDGVLVGGASLKKDEFLKMLKKVNGM